MEHRVRRDYLEAVEALERAQEIYELSLAAAHHAKLAIYEAHQMGPVVDSQLERLKKLNRLDGRGEKKSIPAGADLASLTADVHSRLTEVLQWAITTTRADMGNIQIFDPFLSALQIHAQLGFDRRFLDHFNNVHEGEAACGTALRTGSRVVVEDVTESPIFLGSESLEVMLDARARAVQSTPILSKCGSLFGVLSTHYHRPGRSSEPNLQMLDLFARRAARFIGGDARPSVRQTGETPRRKE